MLSTLEKPVAPFPTVWMDTGSPPRTQTYQLLSTLNPTRSLSRNAGLLVSYTNYLTPPQTTSATNLKLHTNPDTPPVSTSVNPPNSTLAPAALKVSLQSTVFYCWGRPLWYGWNIHFSFVSSLYVLNKKWKGGQSGTYLRLTIGVVGSAGERRKT